MYRVVAIATLLAACGGSTPYGRTAFELRVGARSDLSRVAATGGWQVALSRATIELGALTFFSGAPLVAPRSQSLGQRLARALRWLWPIGSAHAHPGHYEEGGALAELRIERRVDLLAGDTAVGRAAGVTGDYGSFAVDIGSVEVAGSAVKDGAELRFRALLDVGKTVVGAPVVEGFSPARGAAQQGLARLVVDAAQWVARIDFSSLAATSARQTLVPETQPHNALTRGVYNAAAFEAIWVAR